MKLKNNIESILFVRGEPMSIRQLSKITKESEDAVRIALDELSHDLDGRGIILIEKGDEWQLATHRENRAVVEDFMKGEFTEELTKAALETLAVVAYKGPLTRAEVEYIRGVNSSFTMRNLLMRGLIERKENPKDARSYLYEISFDFLKHFGLQKKEDLPEFAELREKEIALPDSTAAPEKNITP